MIPQNNKIKFNNIKSRNRYFAVIGLIVVALLVVWLVRKPAHQDSVQSGQDGQVHSEGDGHEHEMPNMQAVVEEISQLEKTVAANPQDFESLLALAHRYQDTGQLLKSINIYTKYLQQNPTNADARIDLGVSYYQLAFEDTIQRMNLFQMAIAEMRGALKFSPKHQLGHFNLGIVSLQSGNIEGSRNWFNKCIEIDSRSDVAKKAKEILEQHIK
ncbi:MAG: hypothetical protein KKF20_05655 [Bacteroidetes bacterium]|nr:hypothetical protein [Bacteroidota bacterium]MBU1422905.1 hypothetical protein [Bacteroidota bacterium]MBU2471875.1 hypothetical protein [Bacteroidota bacterium]MBU2636752.1 hypothetical protein [Bacteroidota bacterium]